MSYFIVNALGDGDLNTALSLAAAKLPKEEMRDFELSNILYMLNSLLRYIHPNFTDHNLNCVEKLVDRVGSESFHIRQKIAAIREHSASTRHQQPL